MKTLLAFVLLTTLGLPAGLAGEKRLWARFVLGQKAPDFVVEKWLTQEPDRAGKFVIIDFSVTWCGPCRKAIPELNAFQKNSATSLSSSASQ